jgi:hypothetical protein
MVKTYSGSVHRTAYVHVTGGAMQEPDSLQNSGNFYNSIAKSAFTGRNYFAFTANPFGFRRNSIAFYTKRAAIIRKPDEFVKSS